MTNEMDPQIEISADSNADMEEAISQCWRAFFGAAWDAYELIAERRALRSAAQEKWQGMERQGDSTDIKAGDLIARNYLRSPIVDAARLAFLLKVKKSVVVDLIAGRAAVIDDLARRVAELFGTSAEFWLRCG